MEAQTPQKNDKDSRRLDMLLDVPLDVNVELGRTRMTIQDLLQLGPGSVIELDKVAGEALDILVNGRLVARGEAVVVNDKFGIRITDIVSPQERIQRLR
jgi:flagellar motor switch protein FliN